MIYPIYDFYVDNYGEWTDSDYKGELSDKYKTAGPIILHGTGVVSGKLWGGCVESLEQLKQTKYYPSESLTTDKILFFETFKDKPFPEFIRSILYNYAMQGMFHRNKAVMFGIFKDYNDDEKELLYKYIKDVIIDEYNCDVPIIVNCPIGHTAPTWFLPYNEILEIDLDNIKFLLKKDDFCIHRSHLFSISKEYGSKTIISRPSLVALLIVDVVPLLTVLTLFVIASKTLAFLTK